MKVSAMLRPAIVGLTACAFAACSPPPAGDAGAADGGTNDGAFAPPLAPMARPNEWGVASEGLPASGFTLRALATARGRAYAAGDAEGRSAVYELDAATLRWSAVAPPGHSVRLLTVGPEGALYAVGGRALSSWNEQARAWTRLPDAPRDLEWARGTAAVAARLFAASEVSNRPAVLELDLSRSPAVWTETAPAERAAALPERPSGYALTRDGSVWTSFRWAVRDTMGRAGAVFRLRPSASGAATWADATENLRETNTMGLPTALRNQTGNGWGPFGSVTSAPESMGADAVYGDTEQGVFRHAEDGDRWEKVQAFWGGSGIFSSASSLFFAQRDVRRVLSPTRTMRLGQPSLYSCARQQWRAVVAPTDDLVVAWFHGENCAQGQAEPDALVTLRVDPNAQATDRDLTLEDARYVGGSGDEQARGAVFTQGGRRLSFAGNVDGVGRLWSRPAEGSERPTEAALDGPVEDLCAAGDDTLRVGTDRAVLFVEPDASSVRTRAAVEGDATGVRVDASDDGTTVAARGHTLTLLSPQGAPRATAVVGRSHVTDVAIARDGSLVYVVGFDQQRRAGVPVQVPYLEARRADSPTLEVAWKSWGYDPNSLGEDMADSRLYRVYVAHDGALYVLGEAAGGNTVFRWNGRDLRTRTSVTWDIYNDLQNTGDEHKLYYARLDARTGAVLAGQFAVPRLGNNRGNTYRAEHGAIAVDGRGRVYVLGTSASAIDGRDLCLVGGVPASPYAGGDIALLVVSPDFSARLRWSVFSRAGGGGTGDGLAVTPEGRVAVFATVEKGDLFTTEGNAPASDPGDGDMRRDAWLGVFSQQ